MKSEKTSVKLRKCAAVDRSGSQTGFALIVEKPQGFYFPQKTWSTLSRIRTRHMRWSPIPYLG